MIRHAFVLAAALSAASLGLCVFAAGSAGARGLSQGRAETAADVGYLTVTSTPSGAHVYIDDRDTGSTTPLQRYELKAGLHKVLLVADGGTRRQLGVRVTAGKENRLDVTM